MWRIRLSAASASLLAGLFVGAGCSSKDATTTGPSPAPPNGASVSTRPGAPATTGGPSSSQASPTGESQTGPAEEKKDGATIEVTSELYYRDYEANKEATKKKYQDATIVISGTIVLVSADATGRGMIGLNAEPKKVYPWVTCLVSNDPEPWARYAPGQSIKLRGQFPKVDVSQPVVIRCTVLEAGPNPAITTTAAKLADEFAEAKGAKEKYAGKYLYVTGEVDEAKKNLEFGGMTVLLKGNGMKRVPLQFAPADGAKYEEYKPGSTVKIFAKFDGEHYKVPSLRDCELITK